MSVADSRVTIHMAASLDGFIARRDGRVEWLDTSDHYADGETMAAADVSAFLATIDCYVMGSRTYETALRFAQSGAGWAYGDTPVYVLTTRELPRIRPSVEFYAGDLSTFVNATLRHQHTTIWCVGGAMVAGEFLRLGLADDVRCSILPVLIGDGIPFFGALGADIALHLAEVHAYATGMLDVRYEIRGSAAALRNDEAPDTA
jgi:dihydrofolate reductase